MRWTRLLPAGLLWGTLALLPGCAIYDPYQVWRFQSDFNSERALSAQWTTYDHLPPKVIRMRLMKWGYNVGPSPERVPFAIPSDSPVRPLTPLPLGVQPGSPIPPAPGADLLDQSLPPALPPIENAPAPSHPLGLPNSPAVVPEGPTALRSSTGAATPASWIFTSP